MSREWTLWDRFVYRVTGRVTRAVFDARMADLDAILREAYPKPRVQMVDFRERQQMWDRIIEDANTWPPTELPRDWPPR